MFYLCSPLYSIMRRSDWILSYFPNRLRTVETIQSIVELVSTGKENQKITIISKSKTYPSCNNTNTRQDKAKVRKKTAVEVRPTTRSILSCVSPSPIWYFGFSLGPTW